jgi:hypothetical protein
MSAMQLFIGYAHNSCESAQVAEAFENALNEQGIVEQVDFRVKKGSKGEDFKIFFIHFHHENRQLQHMMSEIKRHGFSVLTYAQQWDKKQNRYVERYWKVLPFVKKEPTETKFVPRIMTLEEASAAGISAPKTKTEVPKTPEKSASNTEAPNKPEKPLPLEPVPACWKEDTPPPRCDEPLPEVPPEKPKLTRQVAVKIDDMSAIDELFTPKPKRSRRRSSPEPENLFAKLSLEETKPEDTKPDDTKPDDTKPEEINFGTDT